MYEVIRSRIKAVRCEGEGTALSVTADLFWALDVLSEKLNEIEALRAQVKQLAKQCADSQAIEGCQAKQLEQLQKLVSAHEEVLLERDCTNLRLQDTLQNARQRCCNWDLIRERDILDARVKEEKGPDFGADRRDDRDKPCGYLLQKVDSVKRLRDSLKFKLRSAESREARLQAEVERLSVAHEEVCNDNKKLRRLCADLINKQLRKCGRCLDRHTYVTDNNVVQMCGCPPEFRIKPILPEDIEP